MYTCSTHRFADTFPVGTVVAARNEVRPVSEVLPVLAPQGYRQLRAFIATQAPLPSTVEDLWQMVWEQESRSIVALTTPQEMTEQVRTEGEGDGVFFSSE